jgi:DedD protein
VLTNVAKTPVSDEELQLKKKARRRLVGAVVLVLLVVVFVPMFLDRAPRPQKQDIDIRIPPIPGQAQTPSQPAPPAVLPPAAPEPAPAPAAPPATPPEKPAVAPTPPINPPIAADTAAAPPASAPPSAPAPRETPAPTPRETPATADVARKPDPKSAESFVIQVGAFSDPVNARHLVEKLKSEKVPAYTESVKTPQGDKTRVRAGPYPTMAAAERGRNRLKTLKLVSGGEPKIVHKGE